VKIGFVGHLPMVDWVEHQLGVRSWQTGDSVVGCVQTTRTEVTVMHVPHSPNSKYIAMQRYPAIWINLVGERLYLYRANAR
jgi:hypothetical protein